MAKHLRIAISTPDDRGLLAAVTARLFDLGGDLGDTAFAVLGEAAELTCVCTVPDGTTEDAVQSALAGLPGLEEAEVVVRPFELGTTHDPTGRATHVVRVRGEDRPGLVARLAEGFAECGANVVRMNAEHVDREYVMRFDLWIPEGRSEPCLANAANVAEQMGLRFSAVAAD
jgi:glycine cleavage system transcriptional repressor